MDGRSRDARQSADYSARTVAEAVAKAAEDLGVSVDQLNYRVIKDSSHSILGLVRTGEAVIRVFMPAAGPRAEAVAPVAAPPSAQELVERPAPEPELEEVVEAEEEYEEEPEGLLEEEEEEEPAAPGGNPPELEAVSTDVVSTLLDKMGLIAAVEVADRGGKVDPVSREVAPLVLNVVGDDLGVLIGRRGETLRDLQFIVRLIVSRKIGQWPNLVLDVEGYKARRVNGLQALAKRMADQVRQTRQPMVLEPMPAHERRIVHLTLRDDPDVYTESTGEDEARKVQILPK
jgi:spoIIIJ-associated protein